MPDYYIDIPHSCPIRFVPVNPTYDPRYHVKHFDDFWFSEQILDFEQQVQYYHKVQNNDKRKLQFKSTVGQPQLTIYDCYQKAVVGPILMSLVPTSIVGQPWNLYEKELDFSTINGGIPLPEGKYWIFGQAGAGPYAKFISEGLDIKTDHLNTAVFEYSHSENDFDTIWETGIVGEIRIDAVLKQSDIDFKRKRASYDDQTHNHKTLSSVPFRTYKLIVGASDGSGVAPWIADKLNYIFGCSSVQIDGKEFTPDESAEFEKTTVNGYPKAGYAITLREAKNLFSKRVFATGSGNQIWVTYKIRTKLFGTYNGQPSTLDFQITDAE